MVEGIGRRRVAATMRAGYADSARRLLTPPGNRLRCKPRLHRDFRAGGDSIRAICSGVLLQFAPHAAYSSFLIVS